MRRERALKIVLVVVGLLFTAGVVPLTMFFSREPSVPMLMSIYVTLGIFLLLAVRDPAANRSLIAFGGWANLAPAGVMYDVEREAQDCHLNADQRLALRQARSRPILDEIKNYLEARGVGDISSKPALGLE